MAATRGPFTKSPKPYARRCWTTRQLIETAVIETTCKGSQPSATAKGNVTVSHWNYRVVQSADQTEYFIAEVYYDGDGAKGWVDDSREFLRWDDYDDLKGSVEWMKKAFDKPLLRVVEGDRLVEVTST
jgi:hypothetical protein